MALRVLIIEDNKLTREMLKGYLGMLGHEVVAETESLNESLAAYKKHRPDAVTIDLSLPKEDGLSIMKALLRSDAKARVIVITGNTQERVRQELLQAGAAGIIYKPIEVENLRNSLENISSHGNNPTRPASHPPAN